jgi:hypothetical protein
MVINLDFLRLELEFILMKLLLPLASSVMLTVVTSKETASLSYRRTQSVPKTAILQNTVDTHCTELHLLVTLRHGATCECKRFWDHVRIVLIYLPPLRRTTSYTFRVPHHNNNLTPWPTVRIPSQPSR